MVFLLSSYCVTGWQLPKAIAGSLVKDHHELELGAPQDGAGQAAARAFIGVLPTFWAKVTGKMTTSGRSEKSGCKSWLRSSDRG